MRAAIKVNEASVRFLKNSLLLNSRLGDRISTASFDILGEERWATPSSALARTVAIGGYIRPWGKDEVHIDRSPTPFVNCAATQAMALGGNSSYIDHFFGGYLSTVEIGLIGRRRFYRCTAQDYNVLPTQKRVTKSYVTKTEQEIIDDLFTTYLPDINTTTYVESSGTQITIDWTRIFLDKCLEEVANIFGKQWYIDHELNLHYFTPVTTAAPFELSSSPSLTTKIGYDNFRYLEDDSGIINDIDVIGDAVVQNRQDNDSFAKYGFWYEGKLVDKNIDTNAWAILRGDAVLAELAFSKVWGALVCHQEGLVVGQKVKIYNYLRNLDDYYLVQVVQLTMINNFTERVAIEYGDFNVNLVDLLLKIKKETEKET